MTRIGHKNHLKAEVRQGGNGRRAEGIPAAKAKAAKRRLRPASPLLRRLSFIEARLEALECAFEAEAGIFEVV